MKDLEEAKIIAEEGTDLQSNKANARRRTEQKRRAERKLERTIDLSQETRPWYRQRRWVGIMENVPVYSPAC
jgi:hypothetical protein